MVEEAGNIIRTCKAKIEILEPPVKVKPEINPDVLTSIDPNALEDSYVYVHCSFHNVGGDMLIRIWKTTYLIDDRSSAKSELLHIENISFAPTWTLVPGGTKYTFLLVFSSLPKNCLQFDLVEQIDQPGGFWIKNIQRTPTDVYYVTVDS